LKDVARAAGVHTATVSRALDPGKMWLVRPDTRAKVQSAARELGYRADVVARSLRRGQTTTVGVVVADLGNTFVAPAMRGITDALERRGFMALISETQDDHDRLRASIENLLSRRVDGTIVMAARLGDAPLIEEIAREDHPVVLAVRTLPGSTLPSVTSDDVAGGRLAARHLAELGHTRVAELRGPHDVMSFVGRARGFSRAAEELGLEVVSVDGPAIHPTPSEGQRLMEKLLSTSGALPTAVFAHNDAMAIGALAALRAAGLRCPDDVSVLGYNDAPLAGHLDPPLSTVRFQGDKIGRFAAEAVIAMIEDRGGVVASVNLPPELVVRASTAPPRR
jgi:LacI family transcriptional regulator